MNNFPIVVLHQQKTQAVRRFHPWVFSGAIKSKDGDLQNGDIVQVVSSSGDFLGVGHYGTGSIAVRLFSFTKFESLDVLWREKFRSAFNLRKSLGITENPATNAYRLVNAEGDGMPGLVIDWYNGTAVIQCHSVGMYAQKDLFTQVLKEGYGDRLSAVYDKSNASLHVNTGQTDSYLLGEKRTSRISEYGHQFVIDWERGQKTGFFIDQRENRNLLGHFSKGKKVLNTFCYTGGFSVYAAANGASLVHSVDSSAKAMETTNENIHINGFDSVHAGFTSDVFDFFKTVENDYDVIILDPPAFAKGQAARHSAIKAYTRLNHAALEKIKSGGIVFTFSCSQAVSPDLFLGAVTAASIESRRKIRILQYLNQPADHPVSIYHPEGQYLKGLILHVE